MVGVELFSFLIKILFKLIFLKIQWEGRFKGAKGGKTKGWRLRSLMRVGVTVFIQFHDNLIHLLLWGMLQVKCTKYCGILRWYSTIYEC